MMREKYESLALHDLKEIAKARGMKGISAMKKAELVEAMLALDEKEASEKKGKEKEKEREKEREKEKAAPESAAVREPSGEYRESDGDRENRRPRPAGRYQDRYNSP